MTVTLNLYLLPCLKALTNETSDAREVSYLITLYQTRSLFKFEISVR